MNDIRTRHGDDKDTATNAEAELARLQQETGRVRSELLGLQQQVAEARGQLESMRSTQLVEANEQLVVSALLARTDLETAALAQQDASRSIVRDALTGLPNRLLLSDRLEHAIANAKRHGKRLALLFVDLDNFKQIDDAHGHAFGDEVLKRAAHCVADSVREVDTVSRHGGGEFLILLDEVLNASDAVVVADKIFAALAAPHDVDGQVIHLAASIGISVYPDDGVDAAALIERADAAMFRAKRLGLGGFVAHGEKHEGGGSSRGASAKPGRDAMGAKSPGDPLQNSQARGERVEADHNRLHAHQQEANQQLVLAALGAQELQAAAELAQRQQTEFLAVLAHELRNPLAPIATAAALLGRVGAEDLPGMQAVIERQVSHMSRLVSDLLDLSRVKTGKLRLQRRIVDLAGLIQEAADACRPAMNARAQRFDMQLPACTLDVDGDPVRLAQVFSNLLDNACKYTPQGGEIGLVVEMLKDAVVVAVSDTGIGITAQALPHVFEPFAQDPHATGFNGAGLGIGLTVVRELVEAHGGSVVASSPGSGLGSCFVVTLPLAGCARPAPPQLS